MVVINMKYEKRKTLFRDQFGDTPQLRVLDFLIDNHFFDYPVTAIARESNVSYNSLKLFLKKFIESGILIKTRKIGKSEYYKLNIENSFVSNLIKLDWLMMKRKTLPEKEIPVYSYS